MTRCSPRAAESAGTTLDPDFGVHRIKLASCRQNIELGSPGLEWRPESSTLDIEWLSGPTKPGEPAELTLRIGSTH